MTSDGIHSMAFEQYVAADGISKSMLDYLAHPYTPAHLRAHLDEPRSEPTEAQLIGTITHRAIFEPDTMVGAFWVKPEGMKFTTKEGKKWQDDHQDRQIVSADTAEKIRRMVQSVWAHPIAKRLLTGSSFERSLFAKDEHGTLRKARLDVLTASGNMLPDLKTCDSAAPEDFEKTAWNYRYHVQAAYYLDICALLGIEREKFLFICVEKAAPYCVAVHEMHPILVEHGRKTYQRDLALYRQCVETGEWPGYPTDVHKIAAPAWAMKEIENTL